MPIIEPKQQKTCPQKNKMISVISGVLLILKFLQDCSDVGEKKYVGE